MEDWTVSGHIQVGMVQETSAIVNARFCCAWHRCASGPRFYQTANGSRVLVAVAQEAPAQDKPFADFLALGVRGSSFHQDHP